MKIAVVGATGMVGKVMLQVLKEERMNITQLIPVASEKSIGSTIAFDGNNFEIVGLNKAIEMCPDIAIFSAGGSVSEEWAPKFASRGTIVIDNSSFWRMDPSKKLIVPEVNGHLLSASDKIIPNPNCSTIQLVMVLKPLHDRFKIKRVVVSTYQSISGTGVKAVQQMEDERNSIEGAKVYPYAIDKNCIPQCDVFLENDYTKEEMKLTNETKKIIDLGIQVTATAVRIPVIGGHSESVNIEFENEYEIDEVKNLLNEMSGVTLQDAPSAFKYPMPISAHGKNDVFVGRIRRDESQPKSLNLWIVADNLRKGAATNAVQIAKLMAVYVNN
ncbi:MAG: aspartate-semialdehyde dehydrogenase [Crocinitomicaceae bacterium]|nr:aspartate-semialdehyde dehydrogenase [Crocinitomicaceae bacterium]MDG1734211.1 aspartate-semialdehyde dehydrogenase [Crocinitomicaceae bacterium]MDG2505452.1 aspartate-semialdehyde dehydrogenase [Crocinitomicaceae bacterium]